MAAKGSRKGFVVGDHYDHESIYTALGIGNAGGIRCSKDSSGHVRRLALFTAMPTAKLMKENPYCDRLEGNTLVYTGAGQIGDQMHGGINKRIAEQPHEKFPIYCFMLMGSRRDRSLGPKRWRFIGMLYLLRSYSERQIDSTGKERRALIYEFRVFDEPKTIFLSKDREVMTDLIEQHKDEDITNQDERAIEQPVHMPVASTGTHRFEEIEGMRARMMALQPAQFEHLVKDALVASGFEAVNVTRFSQDGGIDVIAKAGRWMWPVRNLEVQLQAKRWMHTVGRREVAELRGSLRPHSYGAVVTTSHFSKAALLEANESGKKPIVLVDGMSFAEIVLDCGRIQQP
jgi:hypothetical protein